MQTCIDSQGHFHKSQLRSCRWLHGFAFQLIDAVLFLDMRFLLVGLYRRLRGYASYRRITHKLQHQFLDARQEDLAACGDECAICKDTMKVGIVVRWTDAVSHSLST